MLAMHNLDKQGAKGVATPGDKEIDKMKDGNDPLNDDEKPLYQTGTGIGIFLSGDRYDIRYNVKECARESAKPTKRAKARLKRIARYLVSHRRLIMKYRFLTAAERAAGEQVLRVFVDSNHAGCPRTRRSSTGGVAMGGPHSPGGNMHHTAACCDFKWRERVLRALPGDY